MALDRRAFLKSGATAVTATAVSAPFVRGATAQSRRETLLLISENPPNSTDIHGVGANRPAYEASWNLYDRLMSFGVKKDAEGNDHYDYTKLQPELAEDWDLTSTSVTFKLRRSAKFHDGTPVTAKDVKWSFDRAVTVGGFPTFQMRAGSLEKPEQFVVVDDHTIRIDFLRTDKLTMPDLAVPVPAIYNSELAKKNATAQDPWAMEWLRSNPAAGGAYRLERWVPGQEMVFARFDDWTSGPMPKLQRVIWRIVPQSGNRRALLERGDADISFDLPPRDFQELKASRRLKIIGTPVENAMQYIGMNTSKPPFDNPKVRQAVAFAIPYQQIMDQVVYGQAVALHGGPREVGRADWPQSHWYVTDLDRAKALLAEAGHPNGFETTLSFDLGLASLNEPLSILVQENLAKIGIRTTINKVPGANWRNELLKKEMPLITNTFGGWLNFPDYFFFWAYHGQNAVFNTMAYKNPTLDAMVDKSRYTADQAEYESLIKTYVTIAFEEVPRIPLFQPFLNVAMQNSIEGYRYWFHRQLDYRTLSKA